MRLPTPLCLLFLVPATLGCSGDAGGSIDPGGEPGPNEGFGSGGASPGQLGGSGATGSPAGGGSPLGVGGGNPAPADRDVVGNTGDGAGGEDTPNASCKDLPVTLVRYCTRASGCSSAGAGCPLFVVHNTNGPFDWLDDPTRGPMVVTRAFGTSDGVAVKHWMSEVALTVKEEYPGIDPGRVFFIGWSHGAGAAYRGMCSLSKGGGISVFGNNADIYAGMATAGGCPACSEDWTPTGTMHTFAVNGDEDIFNGGDGCESALRLMAADNGCSGAVSSSWQNVAAVDPMMSGGDGSADARKLDLGDCPGGAVLGYRFRDEGHTLSFDAHWDPAVKGIEMMWHFLKDKQK